MPIYEYECLNCGDNFESLQMLYEMPLAVCPKCGCGRLKKCVSLASFRLKGKGFYATDYNQSPVKNTGDAETAK